MDEVVENLKACLLTSKGGINFNRINKDYYDLVGERIPYRKFNFQSLEEFLSVVPGLRKVRRGNDYFFEAIPSEKTSHVAELVQKQRTDKKARRINANAYRRPSRPPFAYNPNYQRNQPSFRPQPAGNQFYPNARASNNFGLPKSQNNMKRSPSPTSNVSFRYPTANNGSSNSQQINERPLRTFNETSRISPTQMVEKDVRGFVLKVYEPEKPKSSLQNRLVVNPKTNETVNIQSNSNGFQTKSNGLQSNLNRFQSNSNGLQSNLNGLQSNLNGLQSNSNRSQSKEEAKPVLNIPFIKTSENYERDDPSKYQSVKVSSIIPFEQFANKTPQEELRFLAKSLNLPDPIYKISTAQHRTIFASVMVDTRSYYSYPIIAKSEDEAKRIAASKALVELKKKDDRLPVTKDEELVKKRILKIIDCHPTGVFTTQLIKYYKEEFHELLPEEWSRIIKECPDINVEKGADSTSILTRYIPVQIEEKDISPVSPFKNMQLSHFVQATPGVLQIPNEIYWITHVTVIYNTSEIMVQIVGKDYSDKFLDMTTSMIEFYTKNLKSTEASKVEVDSYYTICVENNWYRVKCNEVNPSTGQAVVDFIDFGDYELCHVSMLHELDKQFCQLPAQALKVSLYELEDFPDFDGAKLIIENYLMDRTLHVEVKNVDSEEVPSVIFYGTKGKDDINLNQVICSAIIDSCIPKPQLKLESVITEVYVSHISPTGEVYIQFKDNSLIYLVQLMNKLIEEKLSKDLSECTVTKVNLMKIYVVKSSDDGNWYRARVLNVNYLENEVDALCVDFGKTCTAKITDLVDLEKLSGILTIFPAQGIEVQLQNIPQSSFDVEKFERLKTLTPPEQPLLMKVIQRSNDSLSSGSLPVVELFKRQQPNNEIISINNTVIFDSVLKNNTGDDNNNNVKDRKRSERSMSRYGCSTDKDNSLLRKSLKKPDIPNTNEYFDVHVTLVSNPGYFVVQPFEYKPDLEIMNNKLYEECSNYKGEPLTIETVKEGSLYAAQHSDGYWYRVCALNTSMVQMSVSVYFCDYGEVALINIQDLQPLSGQFTELPYQAIRAKLADVKAINADWLVEDCIRFKDLIQGKNLVSQIKNIIFDGDETVLSLALIDVSKEYNLNIDEILIKEGRAQRTESYLNSNT